MEVWPIDTFAPGTRLPCSTSTTSWVGSTLAIPPAAGGRTLDGPSTDPRRINVVVTVGTTVNAAHRPRPGAVLVAKIGEITRLHLGPNLTRSPGQGDAKD